MEFAAPLIPGLLLRRYKRFLADVELADGTVVTAHCANPGAMLGLNAPGQKVWLEPNDNPKRKLKHTWRLVELGDGHWAGIDTGIPNIVVGEALRADRVPGLDGFADIRAEVRYGTNSRVDFLGTGNGKPDTWIEVKNVHLRRTGTLAEFPDSVTKRGAKHLGDLADRVRAGDRAVMLYCIQRTDCDRLSLAADIDSGYASAFAAARDTGVEAMAMGCIISPTGIVLDREIKVDI